MNPYLILTLTFGAGFLLVFGLNILLADFAEASRQRVLRRVEEELQRRPRPRARKASTANPQDSCDMPVETMPELPTRRSLREWFESLVYESGLALRPGHLLIVCAVLAVVIAALVVILWGSKLAAAVAAPIAAGLPLAYVAFVRSRRRAAILAQLADAFELMNRTMRAGQTIAQGLQAVADEFSPPIAEEFGYCYDQQNLGLSLDVALRELARRTGLLEIKIFTLAVTIHRQTGGNLCELLAKLSVVIRERYRIRGVIQALTAEGRLQALVLLVLPPVMFLIMFLLNRPYIMLLFEYPLMLGGMLVSMLFGALWMHRIVHFDF